MSKAEPIVRHEAEGERRHFWGGGLITIKAAREETGGSLFVFEDLMSRGKVTPLHSHDQDEMLYVLEGELVVHIDGTDHTVGRLGMALAPRGTPHAFMVTSDTARVLTLLTPGDAEDFYRAASEPAEASLSADAVDFARVGEAAKSTGGMQLLGPPPFSAANAAIGEGLSGGSGHRAR